MKVRQRPFITRSTGLMLLALLGMAVAAQPGLIIGRFGLPTYLVLVALIAVALVAFIAPAKRR